MKTSSSMRTSSGPRESILSRTTAMVVMGIFTLYFLIPLWWLVVASTKDRGQLFSTNALWFADFRFFDNVGQLFAYRDGVYLKWLGNSVLYAGVGGVIATVIAAMCGYALAKYRFPGREAIFNTVLGGVLVPATALALPLFLLFSQVHGPLTKSASITVALMLPCWRRWICSATFSLCSSTRACTSMLMSLMAFFSSSAVAVASSMFASFSTTPPVMMAFKADSSMARDRRMMMALAVLY